MIIIIIIIAVVVAKFLVNIVPSWDVAMNN